MGLVRSNAPLRVRSVFIEGNQRTDPSVIEDELQEAYKATTLEGVHAGLQRGVLRLQHMGIFKSVDIVMQETPTKSRAETDLLIRVEEAGYLKAYVGTSFGSNETGLDGSCTIRNPFGNGESIQGHVGRGTFTQSTGLAYEKPRVWGRPVSVRADLREDSVNNERESSLQQRLQAFTYTLTSHNQRHRLSYEYALRDILPRRHLTTPYAYDASLSVMKEAVPTAKSSVSYRYTDDRRNNPVLPTYGSYFSSSLEVAGVGLGDVAFVKSEASAAGYKQLLSGLVSAGLKATVGVLRPMGWRQPEDGTFQEKPSTCLHDRYFVGGLASARGFALAGVGPRADPAEGGAIKGDSLGGDLKYQVTASLTAPLPLLPALNLQAHAFTDVANLLRWSAPLSHMASQARVSVGCGLAASLGSVRLELDYSVPLRKGGSDVEQRWQFGLAGSIFS